MSPTLNGSSAVLRLECGNAIKVRDRIFNFYTRLPHNYLLQAIIELGLATDHPKVKPSLGAGYDVL